jgi:hypothetical protein
MRCGRPSRKQLETKARSIMKTPFSVNLCRRGTLHHRSGHQQLLSLPTAKWCWNRSRRCCITTGDGLGSVPNAKGGRKRRGVNLKGRDTSCYSCDLYGSCATKERPGWRVQRLREHLRWSWLSTRGTYKHRSSCESPHPTTVLASIWIRCVCVR